MEKDRKVELEECSGGECVISGGGASGCSHACRERGFGGERSGRAAFDDEAMGDPDRFVPDMTLCCFGSPVRMPSQIVGQECPSLDRVVSTPMRVATR